jgi:transposase-like protein
MYASTPKPQVKYRLENYKNISVFEAEKCEFCKSKNIIKWGCRYNHTTKKQRWFCNNCKKSFTVDDGFLKVKNKREIITLSLDLYYKGLSSRKVEDHLEQFYNLKASYNAILEWIRKYAKLTKGFTDKLKVDLSGIYHADEMTVKCEGRDDWFWDLIDKDTRFLVSSNYSSKRDSFNAKLLFLQAKNRADRPKELYTDGLQGYRKAFRKVWGTRYKADKVKYTRIIDREDTRNNIIERIQGTIRERIKVMRGFGNTESAKVILDGLTVYYNFIKLHQGIGMTPAKKAGINLGLRGNRWLELIYLSARNK